MDDDEIKNQLDDGTTLNRCGAVDQSSYSMANGDWTKPGYASVFSGNILHAGPGLNPIHPEFNRLRVPSDSISRRRRHVLFVAGHMHGDAPYDAEWQCKQCTFAMLLRSSRLLARHIKKHYSKKDCDCIAHLPDCFNRLTNNFIESCSEEQLREKIKTLFSENERIQIPFMPSFREFNIKKFSLEVCSNFETASIKCIK